MVPALSATRSLEASPIAVDGVAFWHTGKNGDCFNAR